MLNQVGIICLDADDTLWQNETMFMEAYRKLSRLLSHYEDSQIIERRLAEVELRHLETFGYGIKGFILAMIAAAIELTAGKIQGHEVQQIVDLGVEMLQAEVSLLDGVEETLAQLSDQYQLMLLTKGDLLEQEAKVVRSGLAHYFQHVEVLSTKTPGSYQMVLRKYSISPQEFVMVGNSLKSDILPVLAIGGTAVYIPYEHTWAHEQEEEPPPGANRYYRLDSIRQLPALITQLDGSDVKPA